MILLSFAITKHSSFLASRSLEDLEALQLRVSDVPMLTWTDLLDLDPKTGLSTDALHNKLTPKMVAIAGFAVPLSMEHDIQEFLLVPNALACIHIPAPPANQMVFVKLTTSPLSRERLMGPLVIKGQIKIDLQNSVHGVAGYFMAAETVEAY